MDEMHFNNVKSEEKIQKDIQENEIQLLCQKHPKSALNEKHSRFKECHFFKIGNFNKENTRKYEVYNDDKENKPVQRIPIDQKKRNKINREQNRRRSNLKIFEKKIKKKLKTK